MRRLNYALGIIVTLPFVVLGIVTGLIECLLKTSGNFTIWVVKPFTWAVERKVGAWNAMGHGSNPETEGSHHVDA